MINSDLSRGYRHILEHRDVITSADFLIAASRAERAVLGLSFPGHRRSLTIPFPVSSDLAPFSRSAHEAARQALGIKPRDFLVTYAGRISPQKNIATLLHVFHQLRKQVPHAKLAIAGAVDDYVGTHFRNWCGERYLDQLGRKISELRLNESVVFTGNLAPGALRELWGASDAQISLTAHSAEDFGYAIAQGMAMGLPTVVTRWGGGLDFVRGGGAIGVPIWVSPNGLRVDAVFALQALIDLAAPEYRARWRKRSLAYAQKNLSEGAVLKRWEALASGGKSPDVFSHALEVAPKTWEMFKWSVLDDQTGLSHSPYLMEPGDRFFQDYARAYSGIGPKSRAGDAWVQLNPLIDFQRRLLDDPASPEPSLGLSPKQLQEVRRVFGRGNWIKPLPRRSLRKRSWYLPLRERGVLIPSSR